MDEVGVRLPVGPLDFARGKAQCDTRSIRLIQIKLLLYLSSGCSIVVVYTLRECEVRVRFPAPRPRDGYFIKIDLYIRRGSVHSRHPDKGARSSSGRAPLLQSGGKRFESARVHKKILLRDSHCLELGGSPINPFSSAAQRRDY